MNRQFVAVPLTMPIGDLLDQLQERNLNAAPVLDPNGKLAGIVSLEDILHEVIGGETENHPRRRIRSRRGMLELDELDTFFFESLDPWSRPVEEIMTRLDITVTPDTTVNEVCRILWSFRIHHLPVSEDDHVIGLISSLDLCRALVDGHTIPGRRVRGSRRADPPRLRPLAPDGHAGGLHLVRR